MTLADLAVGSKRFSFDRTIIMGVLNVTPDSFSDGGHHLSPDKALLKAKQMVEDGADILDIGGESTRPFSSPVSAREELGRIVPVLEGLKELDIPISIDTRKPEVAQKALDTGAHMVNDVSGLRDEGMMKLVAEKKVPVVIMHMKGEPKSMQENPEYGDVVGEIKEFFKTTVKKAADHGIKDDRIIIDPGLGFGKTTEHNIEIIKRLDEFRSLGFPVLVGASRKTFIGKILGLDVGERLEGSLAAMAASIMNGADIVRVHDVKESVRVARFVDALKRVE
ncbi:MAG: dihydropteroate synthase [Thermoplasmata archaeon]|nr:dihydropteroate synthase [Thermoplasmata archaeon]